MPKVHMSSAERIQAREERKRQKRRDLLAGEIARQQRVLGIGRKDIAEQMDMTVQALGYKLRNTAFSFDQLCRIFEILEFSDEQIALVMTGKK